MNIDGSPKIVEVDESLFFKRKYNRGRMLEQSWYLAGIVRGTTDIFVEEVEYRNADTLTEVIGRNVAPGQYYSQMNGLLMQ